MGQLSFTAYYSRKLILWGAIGIVVYLIAHYTVVSAYTAWQNRPKEPPPPAAKFGLLPKLDLPVQDNSFVFNYRLETVTGTFPKMPDRGLVYVNFIPKPNLLDVNKGEALAKRLNFSGNKESYKPPIYRWRNYSGVTGLLEMNIYRNTFDVIYDWPRNENLYIDPIKRFVPESAILGAVTNVLSRAGLWTTEWQQGSHAIIPYRFVNGQLVKVDHINKADFFQVNVMRKPLVDGTTFVSADPYRPVVWALVSRLRNQVAELHYSYQPIDESTSTDYLFKPITQVWDELINGKAYISSIGDNFPGQEIIIRHFNLAYYQSHKEQLFTQPVFVIKGDRGFTALVPAIADVHVK